MRLPKFWSSRMIEKTNDDTRVIAWGIFELLRGLFGGV